MEVLPHKGTLGIRMKSRLRMVTSGKSKAKDTGNMEANVSNRQKGPFQRVANLKRKPLSKIVKNKETSEDIIKASKCDLSALREELERVIVPQIPAGVQNIDAGVKDPFKEPTYAENIILYLREQEQKFALPANHLLDKEVTPHMRRVLVDWLIRVQEHQQLEQVTLHLAVTFLDHFLNRRLVPTSKLQLAGVTCVLIAAKYAERFAPEISDLLYLTDNAYSRRQVLLMERMVLRVLCFQLYMPEPSVFLDRFLEIEGDVSTAKVVHLAWYLMDLSLMDASFVHHTASLKAAAALALARDIYQRDEVGQPSEWSPTMAYYTGYSRDILRPIMERFSQVLLHAPASKQTGATIKYGSQSRHLAVAKWMAESELPKTLLLAVQS